MSSATALLFFGLVEVSAGDAPPFGPATVRRLAGAAPGEDLPPGWHGVVGEALLPLGVELVRYGVDALGVEPGYALAASATTQRAERWEAEEVEPLRRGAALRKHAEALSRGAALVGWTGPTDASWVLTVLES